jgi:hypothetical protein
VKTAKKKAKAFRFPKTFTAKVTRAIFDASSKRKASGKGWGLMHDCPVSVAVRRALKLPRFGVSTSQVDCAVHTANNARYRRYTHDGVAIVKAFDQQVAVTLPQTVTFTLAPKEEL